MEKNMMVRVSEIIDDEESGMCKIFFEISDDFKKIYMDAHSLKEWDDEHWNKFVIDSVDSYIEKKECEKNQKNPDFLWDNNKEMP